MNKYTWLLALNVLLCFRLPAQTAISQIDSLMRTHYPNDMPGAEIAVVKNGKLIFQKGYGVSDAGSKQKINAETNFNIGSITKQFTALTILRLSDEKKLSLQDNLLKYFPAFNPHVGKLITIRHLLTHSSGIIDHYAFTDTSVVKHAVDKDVLKAVESVDSTYFTPGTEYRYSNTAYCLLALIIEKITGVSYREYIRKTIFQPLHMGNSQVLEIPGLIRNKAIGYDYDTVTHQFNRLDAGESIFFSTEGDGGIYTSMQDYLKWFNALQSGSVANPAIIAKARSAQFPVDEKNGLSYGYGWFVCKKPVPLKNGNGTAAAGSVYHSGSNGGFRAMVFTIPAKNYAVIIFSNRTNIDLESLAADINRLMGVSNNSYVKIESLVSYIDSWPIFAPCKKTPLYSTLSIKSFSASGMALN
jgi:D-alanyl-D-alanine carboxypeptidase